ncbi:MAG: sigma 54-interacting transcriptional regulator [Planctomycetota bacterium]|nr:sigma 54-interacting transcriptional regulator [Planctomycetota bacterium]
MARRRRRIEKWLAGSRTPVFVLDANRIVCWFNSGCEELTGWPAEEVIGWRCDYSSEFEQGTVDALLASLCPPPELDLHPNHPIPIQLACRDGRSLPQALHVFPLNDELGQPDGFLGVLCPVRAAEPTTTSETPTHRLHAELAAMRHSLRERFGQDSLLGTGPAMARLQAQARLAGDSLSSVCLIGEPGSGREHTARAIHYSGAAGDQSFVPLDCNGLPPGEQANIIDRMFQSPEAGSSSVFQPGSLFLADVDHLPRDIQQRLLDQLTTPNTTTEPSLRLMVSSTRPLEEAVAREDLLPDLHFHASTVSITVPPLRDRGEDFRPLVQHFLERHNQPASRQVGGLAPDSWTVLGQYDWPGNLDELNLVILEAALVAADRDSSLIDPDDLPFAFRTGIDAQRAGGPLEQPIEPLEDVLERVEREQLGRAMQRARGNKAEAARLLGLTRPRLYRRLTQLDMLEDDFEPDND